MKIKIDFGGFYESQHSDLIDSVVEMERDYFLNEHENKEKLKNYLNKENIEFWELYDYKEIYIEYSKMYLELLCEWLKDVGINLDMEFCELVSPKYYNYSTDAIIARLDKLKKHKLIMLLNNETLNEDYDLHELVEEKVCSVTKSSSGYIAFYDFNNVINMIDKEHKYIYIECLFSVICELFNTEMDYNTSGPLEHLYSFVTIKNKEAVEILKN